MSVALPTVTEGFLAAVEREAAGQVTAVYAVGSLALDDFSERQSNIDLVVVSDPPLDPGQQARLGRALGPLRHAGRPAQAWFATWEDLDAGGPGTSIGRDGGGGGVGGGGVGGTESVGGPVALATPMTRAILRHDPVALMGPDWPVVAFDEAVLKTWCAQRLHALAGRRLGLMILRRRIGPPVLECARLAHGAITGRVLSKSEAGEAIMPVVSGRFRRLLTDTVGYRKGAQASMYWGPFERRSHALELIRELDRTVAAPGASGGKAGR